MKHSMKALLVLALAATAVLLPACRKKKGGGGGSDTQAADPNFEKPVSASSVLQIGKQQLVGTKLVAKNEVSTTVDPRLAVFEAELYPKLRTYCANGCHDVNQRPFASDGITLAFEIAKPFITANPEDSQMIKNIKSSHNNTNPDWAPEVAAAILKVYQAAP